MTRLGVPAVPALAVGERAVHGWNPRGYAELLGVPYTPAARLPPSVLAARLDRILESALRLVERIPAAQLDRFLPELDRSLRDLAFHVFQLSLGFVDAMERGRLREATLSEASRAELRDGRAVASFGALVQARLTGWFEGADPREYERLIDGDSGPQSGHDLLERTTWHAAQHVRQLDVLVERFAIASPAPLTVDVFEGLPLPVALW